MLENCLAAGALSRTLLGELTTLPDPLAGERGLTAPRQELYAHLGGP